MDIDLLHGVSETFGFCLVHSHPIVNHTEIDLAAAAEDLDFNITPVFFITHTM